MSALYSEQLKILKMPRGEPSKNAQKVLGNEFTFYFIAFINYLFAVVVGVGYSCCCGSSSFSSSSKAKNKKYRRELSSSNG